MADLPWVPMHSIKILKFNLWHLCDICEERICKSDKECCESTNFIPKYTMTMLVRGPHGEFKLFSKELSVLRALLYMENDRDWHRWITCFRLMKLFSFDTSVDVFKGGPSSDKDLALKQCVGAILRQYGQRPHFFDMKYRPLQSNPGTRSGYYCMLVRPTKHRLPSPI